MIICVIAHNDDNFSACEPQREKMISTVANTAEKLSALLARTGKMFEFEYLHEFHLRIYTRVSIRGLG
jgi:hypothetical protein